MEPFEHNDLLSSTSNQPSWCVLAGVCPSRAEDSSLWIMSRSGSNGRSHDIWAKWWRDWILLVMWPLKTMESVIRLWLISSIYVAYISIVFKKVSSIHGISPIKAPDVWTLATQSMSIWLVYLIALKPFRIAQFTWIESNNYNVSHLSTSPIERVTAKIPSYSSWECYIPGPSCAVSGYSLFRSLSKTSTSQCYISPCGASWKKAIQAMHDQAAVAWSLIVMDGYVLVCANPFLQ